MFGRANTRSRRRKKPDPVVAEATRLFEQHRQKLVEQTQAFIAEQINGQEIPASNGAPNYTDFVRARRLSLLRSVTADIKLAELTQQMAQAEVVQALGGRVSPLNLLQSTAKSTSPALSGRAGEPPAQED
jgi:hypothetical protein